MCMAVRQSTSRSAHSRRVAPFRATADGFGGSSSRIAASTSDAGRWERSNGRRPERSSYRITPSE
ncbi:MAG: hypothetical protein DMD43_10020 [Gemmatimonadetes bacterium]|nr:MAG: hypothetical protein DMD43_10020 [Gemmatimonadota bacterium]